MNPTTRTKSPSLFNLKFSAKYRQETFRLHAKRLYVIPAYDIKVKFRKVRNSVLDLLTHNVTSFQDLYSSSIIREIFNELCILSSTLVFTMM